MGATYLVIGVVVSHGLLRVRVEQVSNLVNGFHIPLLLLLVISSCFRNAIIVSHVPAWHSLVDRRLSSGILTRAVCKNGTIIFVLQQLLCHAFARATGHPSDLSLRCADEVLGRALVWNNLLLSEYYGFGL